MSAQTAVVAGALAQRPGRAGHAWVFLNWMLGFQRLGFDVVFVDRIDPSMGDADAGVGWVRHVMSFADFDYCWSVRVGAAGDAGMPWPSVIDRARDGVLLNVMGYADDDGLLGAVRTRVFLDIDPGFGQAWQASSLAAMFTGHDAYATVGLNVGQPGCGVPDLGLRWIPTLPPVDLPMWDTDTRPGAMLTSVASWRGPFAPVEVAGRVHGLRAHSMRRYWDLPHRTGTAMEVALDIDPTDAVDRQRLVDGGWSMCDPALVAATPTAYRTYVQQSLGEISVAKEVYASLRSGWFSDRTACYLASGRPAVVSDTGLAGHLPVGEGLLTFSDPDEAVGAVAELNGDVARHAKAARDIAVAHLAARDVVGSLLEHLP